MKRSEGFFTALGVGLALGFVVAIGIDASGDGPQHDSVPVASAPPAREELEDRSTPVTRAVAAVASSVVSISAEEPQSRLFGRPKAPSSDGSGVVIDAEGVILTNAHVVSSAARIIVTFGDGQKAEATVIGLAEDLDLAVLRIPLREGLAAVKVGSSDSLLLGEPVIAIGNPFGLGHTVTTGVVSATARALETDDLVFQDFIQTDASINPGNSGGPLLDRFGKLVGITTAIRPDSEGIGFAIPIDRAIKVARDLIEVGRVRLPWLGVTFKNVRVRLGSGYRVVPQVVEAWTSSGEKGLIAGDLVIGVEGRTVQGRGDLNAYLSSFEPGDTLDLEVIREGSVREVALPTKQLIDSDMVAVLEARLGVTLEPAGTSRSLVLSRVSRGGVAAAIGLRPRDMIINVDGQRVQSPKEFYGAILAALSRHRPNVLILARRGPAQGHVALPF